MVEENISKEFRLKNIDETRNYLIEEINQAELMMSKKPKAFLNYIEHFLILGSTITGCVSISAFASSVGIPVGITGSAIGLKSWAITAAIKIFKKKKKKYDKRVLLAKSTSDNIEVLIYQALIDAVISHDEFVLIMMMLIRACNLITNKITMYGVTRCNQ